jgi:acetyltransferase-like isoleucine patch superfamily enzyme
MNIGKLALLAIDNGVVRLLTRAVIFTYRMFDRALCRLRFFALVPTASRTSWCHWSVQIKGPENLTVGKFVTIGHHTTLGAKAPISIGNYVRIGRDVLIETGGLEIDTKPPYQHRAKPIVIGDGAVIYAHAIVLGGVSIGEYSIVSAGCVVNKDVPPYTVVAPARRVQVSRSPRIKKLLAGE